MSEGRENQRHTHLLPLEWLDAGRWIPQVVVQLLFSERYDGEEGLDDEDSALRIILRVALKLLERSQNVSHGRLLRGWHAESNIQEMRK